MKFKVGDRVIHRWGHGPGTVVELNTSPVCGEKEFMTALKVAGYHLAAQTLYDGERYPYVVKYDSGYQDVYSESDLEAAPHAVDNGDGTGSLKGNLVGMGF